MPGLRSKPAECDAPANYQAADRKNELRVEPVYKASGHGSYHSVAQHGERVHDCRVAPGPSEVIDDDRVEHGEGIPYGVAQEHDGEADSEHNPPVGHAGQSHGV